MDNHTICSHLTAILLQSAHFFYIMGYVRLSWDYIWAECCVQDGLGGRALQLLNTQFLKMAKIFTTLQIITSGLAFSPITMPMFYRWVRPLFQGWSRFRDKKKQYFILVSGQNLSQCLTTTPIPLFLVFLDQSSVPSQCRDYRAIKLFIFPSINLFISNHQSIYLSVLIL